MDRLEVRHLLSRLSAMEEDATLEGLFLPGLQPGSEGSDKPPPF